MSRDGAYRSYGLLLLVAVGIVPLLPRRPRARVAGRELALTSGTRSRPPTHRFHQRSPSGIDEGAHDLLPDGAAVAANDAAVEPDRRAPPR